jgi:hypothetical protein
MGHDDFLQSLRAGGPHWIQEQDSNLRRDGQNVASYR